MRPASRKEAVWRQVHFARTDELHHERDVADEKVGSEKVGSKVLLCFLRPGGMSLSLATTPPSVARLLLTVIPIFIML